MARNRTGNYSISSKACDVEYRARRLDVLITKARLALASIDPTAVAEGSITRGLELVSELTGVVQQIAGSKPAKRSYSKAGDEKKAPKAPKAPKKEKAPKAPKASKKEKAPAQQLVSIDEALANMERIAAE